GTRAGGVGNRPRQGRSGRDLWAALPAGAGARGPLAGGRGQLDPEGRLMMRKCVMAAAVTVCTWTVAVPAWAAGDGEKVGENIGNLLGGWAKSLYLGIAAVVALMF